MTGRASGYGKQKERLVAVDIEREDGIAVVIMNRPEALNAFNTEQLQAMIEAMRAIRQDSSLRCVIVTGAGERAFAAGADIKEMVNKTPDEARAFAALGHGVANAIEGLPQPTIAAVNGYAFGGGCEIALACDIRLASDNAVFAQPEVSLGIPPGWGATQRLPRLVGPGIAAEMILTGRRVTAEEALRIGLVNAVVPLPELLPRARDLARQIARNSPRALTAAKRLMSLAFAGHPAKGLETEADVFAESFGTADQREGMRAFLEKRSPAFTGQ